MNDRRPSEGRLPTDSASDASYAHYPAYDSYGQQYSPTAGAEYGDGAPLFGSYPGPYDTGVYDTGAYDTGTFHTTGYDHTGTHSAYGTDAYGTGTYDVTGATYDTGSYDTTQWATSTHDTGSHVLTDLQSDAAGYAPYAHTAYESTAPEAVTYGATAYGHGGHDTGNHPTDAYDTGSYATVTYEATGAYETAGAHQPADPYEPTGTYGTTGGYDTIGPQATAVEDTAGFETAAFETASYEATAIWPAADQELTAGIPAQAGPPPDDGEPWVRTPWNETGRHDDGSPDADNPNGTSNTGAISHTSGSTDTGDADADAAALADAMTQAMPVTTAAAATATPAARRVAGPNPGKPVRGRGRRRPAKRSALLTVAVPSVAAIGVCGVAAASVAGLGGDDKDDTTTNQAGPVDPGGVKSSAANKKLDTQLAGLSASADDFRDRASRTQERIDLKARQALERKRKAEEAARKEAMRPKFALPVTEHGLSALFGQAGVNWMSVHTGIDFPVSYGTPVLAATDGTVRTQWNTAYGNMAIVTAPDGTETWYCHLSSTKVRSGSVKAGDQIAYSGNSGNSTGPHLHFEVRPGGGSPIDPMPWLRTHGLNPN
ncbi:peptidase M23 family protein [Streptomyces sp. NBRC 110611]|uniref:M23 family metallopeptidase n=1 Tax=Streptomyces sp. NBRC 110611 TaxID=1621259 RepID=UPI0008379516|nr:M23 family metallopeptidase [Streptomyces sp. NBRC 110611]GAU64925.1 peptidase M23 family protein [Streptomyces sp. NBRC 110611]